MAKTHSPPPAQRPAAWLANAKEDPLLTPEEAAPLFGVEADTVRKWIREKAIPVVRSGPNALPRIKTSTVMMFRTES